MPTDVRECAFTATAISAPTFFRSLHRSLALWNIAPVDPCRLRWRATAAGAAAAAGGGEIIWSVMGSHCVRRKGRRTGGGAGGGRPSKYRSPPHNRKLRPREQSFTSRSTADKKGLRKGNRDRERASERARNPGEREGGREGAARQNLREIYRTAANLFSAVKFLP